MYNCKINGWISLADVRHLDPEVELDFGEETVPGIPYPVGKITAGKLLEDYDWAARLEEWQFAALSEYNEYHCTNHVQWLCVKAEFYSVVQNIDELAEVWVKKNYGPRACAFFKRFMEERTKVYDELYDEYDIFWHDENRSFVFRRLM